MTNDNLTQILEPNKTPNLVPNSNGFDAGKSHMGVHKLFRLVFFRLRKEKAPWIELAICVAYAMFMGIIYTFVASYTNDGSGLSAYTLRKMLLSSFSTSYNIPGVLIVAAVASFFFTEINFGTLRNQIVSGYSRKEIYTAYWLGLECYAVLLVAVYMGTTAITCGFAMKNGFGNDNVGPFFISLALGLLYEMAITSLAFFLIALMKFPAWPIVIMVLLGVTSMIISMVIYLNTLTNTSSNDTTPFLWLVWMPDVQASVIQSGDYSVITTSFLNTQIFEQTHGLTHTDYTYITIPAILIENVIVLVGSFCGGIIYFDHSDLK